MMLPGVTRQAAAALIARGIKTLPQLLQAYLQLLFRGYLFYESFFRFTMQSMISPVANNLQFATQGLQGQILQDLTSLQNPGVPEKFSK